MLEEESGVTFPPEEISVGNRKGTLALEKIDAYVLCGKIK